MRVVNVVLVCAIFLTAPARLAAQTTTLGGSSVPRFSLAVNAWLKGEDLKALGSLAQLSREGNRAAQILLASIASRGNMHSHVTLKLPRKERVALMRIPGGLSGKSWLTEAQQDEPLAVALLQVKQIGKKVPAIAALIELGEPQTALLAAHSVLLQGEADKLILAVQGLEHLLPEEADVLILWANFQVANRKYGKYMGSAQLMSKVFKDNRLEVVEMAWVGPTPMGILEDTEELEKVIRLSDKVKSWTAMRQFCRERCPSSAGACTAVGASTLWSKGPLSMCSPLASVIPNSAYWSSPRVEGDLARLVPDIRRWAPGIFDGIDACFFDEMEAAQGRHGHGG